MITGWTCASAEPPSQSGGYEDVVGPTVTKVLRESGTTVMKVLRESGTTVTKVLRESGTTVTEVLPASSSRSRSAPQRARHPRRGMAAARMAMAAGAGAGVDVEAPKAIPPGAADHNTGSTASTPSSEHGLVRLLERVEDIDRIRFVGRLRRPPSG